MPCYACSTSIGRIFSVLFGRVYYRHVATIVTLAYLFIGMFIFNAVEAPHEQKVNKAKQHGISLRQQGNSLDSIETMAIDLANLPLKNDILVNWTILSIATPDPVKPSEIVVTFYRANQSCQEYSNTNLKVSPNKWNRPGALLFSLTVLTTIGYGDLAPETVSGKLLCVVYALIGIPLLQIVLEHIRNLFIFLNILIEKRFTCTWYRGTHDTDQDNIGNIENECDDVLRNPKPWTLIVLSSTCIILFLVPSACFSYLEGWDYGTSLYYSFVSVSTIGFGDLIAATNLGGAGTRYHSEWAESIYRIVTSIWIVFGLTFAAGVFHFSRLQLENIFKFITSWRCSSASQSERRANGAEVVAALAVDES